MAAKKSKSGTKREAIIEAALNLFVSQGYDATPIKQIAADADTAEGNLYRHFKSKTELARHLFVKCANDFEQKLNETLDGASSPDQQLDQIIEGAFNFSSEKPQEFAYIMQAHFRSEVVDPKILAQPMPRDVILRVIREGIEQNKFRKISAPLAAAWIVGMVQKSEFFVQRGMTDLSREQVVKQVQDAIHRILKP